MVGPAGPAPAHLTGGQPLWRPVESLTRFLWSMFDTAMNYRDTTQLMLPSYKERAVQIGARNSGN